MLSVKAIFRLAPSIAQILILAAYCGTVAFKNGTYDYAIYAYCLLNTSHSLLRMWVPGCAENGRVLFVKDWGTAAVCCLLAQHIAVYEQLTILQVIVLAYLIGIAAVAVRPHDTPAALPDGAAAALPGGAAGVLPDEAPGVPKSEAHRAALRQLRLKICAVLLSAVADRCIARLSDEQLPQELDLQIAHRGCIQRAHLEYLDAPSHNAYLQLRWRLTKLIPELCDDLMSFTKRQITQLGSVNADRLEALMLARQEYQSFVRQEYPSLTAGGKTCRIGPPMNCG